MITIKTKRLSICVCNFVALKDEITDVGREYSVVEDVDGRPLLVGGFTWRCGGCGRELAVECVMAEDARGGVAPLPSALFDEEAVQ